MSRNSPVLFTVFKCRDFVTCSLDVKLAHFIITSLLFSQKLCVTSLQSRPGFFAALCSDSLSFKKQWLCDSILVSSIFFLAYFYMIQPYRVIDNVFWRMLLLRLLGMKVLQHYGVVCLRHCMSCFQSASLLLNILQLMSVYAGWLSIFAGYLVASM